MAIELLLRARQCLSLERFAQAEALARQAGAGPDALHLLGEICRRLGKAADAENFLRRALAQDARAAAYHAALGNVLQDRGKLKEAIAAYRRALRLEPALAEAWNDLGTAHFAAGDLEAAVECYRKAVRLRPDHAVAYANLGAVYRKLGLLSEARGALTRELWLRLKALVWKPKPSPAQQALDSGNPRLAADIAEFLLKSGNQRSLLLILSTARLRQGRAAEALEAARAAGEGTLELARALAASGQADEAIAAYERAPKSTAALAEAAELRLARGDAEAAEALARRALELDPGDAGLHLVLGEARHRQRAFADAEAAYRRAIELDPQRVAAHVRLSDALRDAGRLDDAAAAARRAVELDADSPLGHFALAMAHHHRGRIDQALEHLERAKRLDPQRVQTLQQLAVALRESDRLEDAARELRAALKLRPQSAELHCDLGVVLGDLMRYDEAMASFRRAREIAPGYVNAMQREALLADHLGDRAAADALLEQALAAAPHDDHLRYNQGLHHLKHGDYARGWDGYEHRRSFPGFIGRHRSFPLPEWDGAPLEGRTLVVLPEQGLGDEIMFASCVPDVARRARHVVIECEPKLEAIFRRSFPACTVVSRQRTLANDWVTRLDPRPELQVAAGSLAGRFRRSLADFPGTPFLQADADSVARWKEKLAALGPGRKIGLSWRGGVGYTGKVRRSLSLEQLLPVLRLPGLQFVNLQYTDVAEEIRHLESRYSLKIHHWQEAIDDYDQTAALVCALDGVLTVCTAIVHLSGALGRPALVMVPFGADWRYGASGSRMAWYGSVTLLRQSRVGEWSDVLAEVARRLQ